LLYIERSFDIRRICKMPVMRSLFYVPANEERFIAKATSFNADVITFDMEDAVPMSEKDKARRLTAENLKNAGVNGAEVYVRVNGWDTGLTEEDLEAVVYEGLDGIVLPKTANAEEVIRLDKKLGELEVRRGLPAGKIDIAVLIETAIGVVNCGTSVFASKRVKSAIFGAVDYCKDMRIAITKKGTEQLYARCAIAVAARAAGIVACDAPFPPYKDMEAFEENTLDGVQMGFEGRMVIHPSQIDVANRLYSPDPKKVQWAEKIVKAFEEEGLAKGKASIAVDGEMVDTPVYLNAKDVLARDNEIKGRSKR
jgi:citrate lyase subunit beta/citryl-CoA lyase